MISTGTTFQFWDEEIHLNKCPLSEMFNGEWYNKENFVCVCVSHIYTHTIFPITPLDY